MTPNATPFQKALVCLPAQGEEQAEGGSEGVSYSSVNCIFWYRGEGVRVETKSVLTLSDWNQNRIEANTVDFIRENWKRLTV